MLMHLVTYRAEPLGIEAKDFDNMGGVICSDAK